MPAGPITMSWSTGSFTLTINGTPTNVPGLTGSATGTISPAGVLNFPQAGITLNSFSATILVPVTVAPAATSAWTGTIDPEAGTATVTGQMVARAIAPPLIGPPGCPLGPFTVQLSATNPGGVAYNDATGAATLTDSTFVLPSIGAVPECSGLHDTINAALGLPRTGGMSLSVTFEPVITGTGAPPPSTTIPTIPTTLPPPPPVETVPVPPVTATAAQGELARTGASSLPVALGAAALVLAGTLAVTSRRATRRREPRD
jgi:hypothetical protein